MKMETRKSTGSTIARTAWVITLAVLALHASNTLLAGEDSALFWSISKQGEPAGFLLGTIHSEDPRVVDFSVEFMDLVASNQVYAMEMVPNLPTLKQLTDFMHYQDGTTLESQIGAERYRRVREALLDFKVPGDWVPRMKVWAVMLTLSAPPPNTGFFMDFSLSLRASGAGMRVVALETLEQQLSFLENMPLEQQLILLDQALKESATVQDIHTQMVDSYLEGDLAALTALADEQMSTVASDLKNYFMVHGVEMRNLTMRDALLLQMQENRVFAAVGALHLPGPTGLIQLLRDEGYTLEALPMPFSAGTQESSR